MSDLLVQLTPELLAIEAADVQRPGMPIAVFLQESHDTLTFAADAQVRAALLAVGLSPAVFDGAALQDSPIGEPTYGAIAHRW